MKKPAAIIAYGLMMSIDFFNPGYVGFYRYSQEKNPAYCVFGPIESGVILIAR